MKGEKIKLHNSKENNTILKQLVIVFFLFIAIFMHCYKLGSIPYGIHIDEMGMGYDILGLIDI